MMTTFGNLAKGFYHIQENKIDAYIYEIATKSTL